MGDKRILYGLIDIHEFVTFMMTKPSFQKKLHVQYKSTTKTVIDKFYEIIQFIINKLRLNIKANTITFDSMKEILQVFENSQQNIKEKNKYEKIYLNRSAQQLILTR